MHLHGIEDISDVKLSYLEVNRQVSFIIKETHKGGNYSVNSNNLNFIGSYFFHCNEGNLGT